MDKMLTADFRKELDTVFNFDFLINQGHTNYDYFDYDLYKVMENFEIFQTDYTNHCWPTVFLKIMIIPVLLQELIKQMLTGRIYQKICGPIRMSASRCAVYLSGAGDFNGQC